MSNEFDKYLVISDADEIKEEPPVLHSTPSFSNNQLQFGVAKQITLKPELIKQQTFKPIEEEELKLDIEETPKLLQTPPSITKLPVEIHEIKSPNQNYV